MREFISFIIIHINRWFLFCGQTFQQGAQTEKLYMLWLMTTMLAFKINVLPELVDQGPCTVKPQVFSVWKLNVHYYKLETLILR